MYTSAAPVPLVTTVKALPDAPPEFAVVTEVPAVPPSAELAVPPAGAVGVTAVDGADDGPGPTPLVATTVKV